VIYTKLINYRDIYQPGQYKVKNQARDIIKEDTLPCLQNICKRCQRRLKNVSIL